MTRSIEQSIKDKVRQIASFQCRSFNEVWLQVIMERWLSRLVQSEYRENFVFKGGMCLSQYLSIGRETRDLDFLVKGVITKREALEAAFLEIVAVDLKDGFNFEFIKLSSLAHDHKQYPGFELTMNVYLGMTRTHLRIDLGVGDNVIPENLSIILSQNRNVPLFEKEIELWAYSPEQIFAEKFQTAVWRGANNSRMKDYHDLVLLIQSQILDATKVRAALETTFQTRKTTFSLIPIFQPVEMAQFNQRWSTHLKVTKSENLSSIKLPLSFEEVIHSINFWVQTQAQWAL